MQDSVNNLSGDDVGTFPRNRQQPGGPYVPGIPQRPGNRDQSPNEWVFGPIDLDNDVSFFFRDSNSTHVPFCLQEWRQRNASMISLLSCFLPRATYYLPKAPPPQWALHLLTVFFFFFFHPRNTTILWFIETGVSFCSNDSFAQTVVFIDFEHFNNIAPFEWSVLTSKLATFQMVVFTRFEHCNKFVSSTFSFLFFVIVLKTTNILKVVHHFQVVLNLCYITLTVISCRFSWISQKSLQWKFSYFLFEETIMIGWSLSIPDVI